MQLRRIFEMVEERVEARVRFELRQDKNSGLISKNCSH